MESYRKCVRNNEATEKNGRETCYCGRDVGFEFHFVNVEHAVRNNQEGGRLLICKKCSKEIYKIMKL